MQPPEAAQHAAARSRERSSRQAMQDLRQAHPIAGVFTPRLVARLHREGFDGSVRFSTDAATRVVYFRRGEIASAASNADADRLPNILIGDGRLTPPQLEMARARQQPGVSLGKTLIDLGFLTPSELLQGARRQVRQILAACFALTEGVYQVSAGPLPREVTVLGLPTRRLIFDALMEAGDRQAIVREMGSMESIYRPSAGFGEGLASLKLDATTETVGRAVDGRRTLRDISSQTSLDDFTVSKVVLALEIMGLAEADRTAAPDAVPQGRRVPIDSDEPGEAIPIPDGEAVPMAPAPPAEPAIGAAAPASPDAQAAPAASTLSAASATPEAADDLPPIPPGELPAFAAPPGVAPEWRFDPETGEKTLPGPVELTFDGQLAPSPGRPRTAWRWGSVAAVMAVVLAAALLASVLRNRQPSRPETLAEVVEERPAAAVEEEPAAPAPPTTPETAPEPLAPAPSEPSAGKERIADAHRLIDEGRVAAAAEAFRDLVREAGGERFTLQVMIACEPATLQKALSATRPEGGLIVLPFPLKGRSCYRACWGIYDSREAALAAVSSLPPYFSEAVRQPVIVPLSRLAPPS